MYRIPSTFGTWKIYVSSRGVRKIVLPRTPPSRRVRFGWRSTTLRQGKSALLVREIMRQIKQYFSCGSHSFKGPFDLEGITPFRKRTWAAMRRIPSGERKTYGELAEMVGSGKAYRAVGNACGANPLPIIFPCHRVVGKGTLGGFSAGMRWKKFLLDLERRGHCSRDGRFSTEGFLKKV